MVQVKFCTYDGSSLRWPMNECPKCKRSFWMDRDWSVNRHKTFEKIVIGLGVTGLCVATGGVGGLVFESAWLIGATDAAVIGIGSQVAYDALGDHKLSKPEDVAKSGIIGGFLGGVTAGAIDGICNALSDADIIEVNLHHWVIPKREGGTAMMAIPKALNQGMNIRGHLTETMLAEKTFRSGILSPAVVAPEVLKKRELIEWPIPL